MGWLNKLRGRKEPDDNDMKPVVGQIKREMEELRDKLAADAAALSGDANKLLKYDPTAGSYFSSQTIITYGDPAKGKTTAGPAPGRVARMNNQPVPARPRKSREPEKVASEKEMKAMAADLAELLEELDDD